MTGAKPVVTGRDAHNREDVAAMAARRKAVPESTAKTKLEDFDVDAMRDTGDLTELRESMQEFGWIEHLPAIADDEGIVVGHRRMKVAEELGIDPVVVRIDFGDGDEATAKRIRLALASNIGSKPLTKDERRRIARQLYGTGEWAMSQIAKALAVCTSTIENDTRGMPRHGSFTTDETRRRIVELADAGLSQRHIMDELELGRGTVQHWLGKRGSLPTSGTSADDSSGEATFVQLTDEDKATAVARKLQEAADLTASIKDTKASLDAHKAATTARKQIEQTVDANIVRDTPSPAPAGDNEVAETVGAIVATEAMYELPFRYDKQVAALEQTLEEFPAWFDRYGTFAADPADETQGVLLHDAISEGRERIAISFNRALSPLGDDDDA